MVEAVTEHSLKETHIAVKKIVVDMYRLGKAFITSKTKSTLKNHIYSLIYFHLGKTTIIYIPISIE